MNRRKPRTIAVVHVQDPALMADELASALGGRVAALQLLRQALAALEEPS